MSFMNKWMLVAVALLACLFAMALVERRAHTQTEAPIAKWGETFESGKTTILNGPWDQAENAWSKLKTARPSGEQLSQWINLQIEILEKTGADPLREEIRLGAIQELRNAPELARPHLSWIKKGIESGLFKEPSVEKKAAELIRELEISSK